MDFLRRENDFVSGIDSRMDLSRYYIRDEPRGQMESG